MLRYESRMAKSKPLSNEEWALWSSWTNAQRIVARAIEQRLQRECGVSKADFSVLMTLFRAPDSAISIGALVEALDWEKSRLSHQLTRMERRGHVQATSGPGGRRTAIQLTESGRSTIQHAIAVHGESVRSCFLQKLSSKQAAAIGKWCEDVTSDSCLSAPN